WDKLVAATEDIAYNRLDEAETKDLAVQGAFRGVYIDLLTRYPLLYVYWQKYAVLEYKLSGTDGSIRVLSQAVDAFPHSLDLWVEYLAALVENKAEETFIREMFRKAVQFNGRNFLSHPLWDKYIEFEHTRNPASDNPYLLEIYLQLVRIPLYQYAQYYQSFHEINKNFSISQLFGETELATLLAKHGKTAELTVEERSALIDDHFLGVFTTTQQSVSERWPFEAEIKTPFFSLEALSDTELTNWQQYLDFEIQSASPPAQVVALFERALVPAASYLKLWMKYIKWHIEHTSGETEKIRNVYLRACNVFVPLDDFPIRLNYAAFLEMSLDDNALSACHLLYQKLIKLSPQNDILVRYLHFITRNYPAQAYLFMSKAVAAFFQEEPELKKTKKDKLLPELLPWFDSFTAIVTLKISKTAVRKARTDVRKLFEKYYTHDTLKSSPQFWLYFFDFELKCKHVSNLSQIVFFAKNETMLPKIVIDDMLTEYRAFLLKHDPGNREIIFLNADSVNSLFVNKSLRAGSAFSPPSLGVLSDAKKEDELNLMVLKQNGHPGITIDQKPTVTNKLPWEEFASGVRELPTFRNVEKASLPIQYPV
ncbi:hypothetical protein BABINDRAFT_22861, partial [Babjeviella inositovora NRRL Y-12698]